MTRIKYTCEELLAYKKTNTQRPEGMVNIPGITISQAPLVKTTFKPAPTSESTATKESKSEENTPENSNQFNSRIG